MDYLNRCDIKVLVIPAHFWQESSDFMFCHSLLREVRCAIPG